MGKLSASQSHPYILLDKLGPLCKIKTQKDDEWEQWGLEDLMGNLKRFVERNLLTTNDHLKDGGTNHYGQFKRSNRNVEKGETLLLAKQHNQDNSFKSKCVYCNIDYHKFSECMKVITIADRKEMINNQKLCYNCCKFEDQASKCSSKGCWKCGVKHHTSIYDKINSTRFEEDKLKSLGTFETKSVIRPTVIFDVDWVKAQGLIDTGARSSYISTYLFKKLYSKPLRKEKILTEQMYGAVEKIAQIHKIKITSSVVDNFNVVVPCISAEKEVLTYLPNPNIPELKQKNTKVKRTPFADENTTKDYLPVHVILGVADYQKKKTSEPIVFGKHPETDSFAEFTKLGWTLVGKQGVSGMFAEKQFFVPSSKDEFEQMCSLDALGIKDEKSEAIDFRQRYNDQIVLTKGGFYEALLPWKSDKLPLLDNKELALGRMRGSTKRLEKIGKLEEYHQIVKDQLIELVPKSPMEEAVHYIPHQPAIKKSAESTKLRIVYDCSARASKDAPSLNDCLEVGPPLQPQLFDILLMVI